MGNCNKEKTGEKTSVKTGEKTGVKTGEKAGVKTIQKTGVKTDKKANIRLTETERRILGLVRENPVITQKELAEILELSNSGIRYAMKGLKEKELLFRTGSRRNGGWKLNE